MEIKQEGDWWKGMLGLDARNKEAFNIDNGTVWSSGKVGDIFEDKFFYVPENFGWLGNQYKDIKSLVSGIGWKVTSLKGELFTKDLKGVSFKERRLRKEQGNGKWNTSLKLEQVAYYDGKDKTRYELGKGVCAVAEGVGNRWIYLFVGFAEVEKGTKRQGRGHEWNFLNDRFFSEKGECEKLKNTSGGSHRLVIEQVGRTGTKDANKGDQVILLGSGTKAGDGILQFDGTKDGRPLIGVLMGVAINLSWDKSCDDAFKRINNGRKNQMLEAIEKCINPQAEKLESWVKNGEKREDSGELGDVMRKIKSLVEIERKVGMLKLGVAKNSSQFKGQKTGRKLEYKYA